MGLARKTILYHGEPLRGVITNEEFIMAKKVQAYVKLQVAAGMANPSPPVGPALGQQGVNIMEFCKAFNAKLIPSKRSADSGSNHRLR